MDTQAAAAAMPLAPAHAQFGKLVKKGVQGALEGAADRKTRDAAGAWRAWWSARAAPVRWTRPSRTLADAVRWQAARPGLEWAELPMAVSSGGAVLGRPADAITLLDVSHAVGEGADVIPIHRTSSPRCPVGRHVQATLEDRVAAVERAMHEELARTTIADLTSDVTRREQRRRARA